MLSRHSRAGEADHASDPIRCTLTKVTTPKPIWRLSESEALPLVSPGEASKAARSWGGIDELSSAHSHGSTASAGWLYVMSDD